MLEKKLYIHVKVIIHYSQSINSSNCNKSYSEVCGLTKLTKSLSNFYGIGSHMLDPSCQDFISLILAITNTQVIPSCRVASTLSFNQELGDFKMFFEDSQPLFYHMKEEKSCWLKSSLGLFELHQN